MKYLFSNNINNKEGFSLIELSIVLIIVGLLVAGTTSGLALVRTARISYGKKLAYNFSLEFEVSIPTPVLWLDANDNSTVVTDSDDNVSKWSDKSRSGNDASQTNSSYQPIHILNGLNGRPAIRFDGLNDLLISTVDLRNTISPNLTIFVVFQYNTENSGIFGNDNGGWDRFMMTNFLTYAGDTVVSYANTAGPMRYSPESAATPHLSRIEYTATTNEVWSDGLQKDTAGAVNAGTGTSTTAIGAIAIVGSYPLDGNIAEMIIFEETLDTIQVQLVEEYLNKKWQIY
ncbi:type II secretion system protein [Pseudomonadota bacterium]